VIALLGNLARDIFPGEPDRTGGAPFHAARALRLVATPALLYARCAVSDAAELLPSLTALGTPVRFVQGETTASFAIDENGVERTMKVLACGDVWHPADVPELPEATHWVHVAPLLRGDFPPATLAHLAKGRCLSLDGQGLVRPRRVGALVPDAEYDPAVLDNVAILKLSDEEAAVLGDLEHLPIRELLLTHGSRGATIIAEGRKEEIEADAVGGNHTGTGDAFSIGYLAARSEGLGPFDAGRSATALVAALLRGSQ
jgi:sugar/nucleoside kinase (ribokinase family)